MDDLHIQFAKEVKSRIGEKLKKLYPLVLFLLQSTTKSTDMTEEESNKNKFNESPLIINSLNNKIKSTFINENIINKKD